MRVYIDICVLNRPFDDQGRLIVALQTQAKFAIQEAIRRRSIELAWSFMLDYENSANPLEERRVFVESWRDYAVVDLDLSPEVRDWAKELAELGLHSKDAFHVASARKASCKFFVTTDRRILKMGAFGDVEIVDPIMFLEAIEEITDD